MMWERKERNCSSIVTPLPATITRERVISTLHNHAEMIELNPLVVRYDRIKVPAHAPAEEFPWAWFQLTDKLFRFPRRMVFGEVTYKASFNDLPHGLQTHVYAPGGLDIKTKWTVEGQVINEPREHDNSSPNGAPRETLYLREDVDMRCHMLMTTFVRRTLRNAHDGLVKELIANAGAPRRRGENAAGGSHSRSSD